MRSNDILPQDKFTKDTSSINCWNQPDNYLSKISFKSPKGQWVAKHERCALQSTSGVHVWAVYLALKRTIHYCDVIMGAIASQVTSITIVYSTVYSDADQRKHQSSASLAFVRGIYRGHVNSPHKRPVTRKMFSFHDVIILTTNCSWIPAYFCDALP